MRRMKRSLICVIMVLLLSLGAGCGKQNTASEDFQRANCRNTYVNSIMKTESGYYYGKINSELELHYYDSKNGKNMYLCNKPECRHDGNEFCAATSNKYTIMEMALYGDDIYINAIEQTEKTYQFKLLRASGDGSSLSEVVTYFETDAKDRLPGYYFDEVTEMVIHRGRAFLAYSLVNVHNKDIGVCGTAIYDLQTGELTYLWEKDMDLTEVDENFCGCGDYMFFIRAKGSRKHLYRYSYKEGSLEKMELERGFRGQYALYDENTCFYIKDNGDLYLYKHDTGENINVDCEKWSGMWQEVQVAGRSERINVNTPVIDSVLSDGEYVYTAELMSFDNFFYPYMERTCEIGGETVDVTVDYVEVIVLNSEGELVNEVKVSPKEVLGKIDDFTLHFTDDTVYMQTSVMVYECPKEDFVEGKVNFTEAYPVDIERENREEKVQ